MASKTQVTLIDGIDGATAAETIRISLDGLADRPRDACQPSSSGLTLALAATERPVTVPEATFSRLKYSAFRTASLRTVALGTAPGSVDSSQRKRGQSHWS